MSQNWSLGMRVLCKTLKSIREIGTPTMGRTLRVRRLNRESIDYFPEEDVRERIKPHVHVCNYLFNLNILMMGYTWESSKSL
jgi:hypothetical protein